MVDLCQLGKCAYDIVLKNTEKNLFLSLKCCTFASHLEKCSLVHN